MDLLTIHTDNTIAEVHKDITSIEYDGEVLKYFSDIHNDGGEYSGLKLEYQLTKDKYEPRYKLTVEELQALRSNGLREEYTPRDAPTTEEYLTAILQELLAPEISKLEEGE